MPDDDRSRRLAIGECKTHRMRRVFQLPQHHASHIDLPHRGRNERNAEFSDDEREDEGKLRRKGAEPGFETRFTASGKHRIMQADPEIP